jgi:hypothetical protein
MAKASDPPADPSADDETPTLAELAARQEQTDSKLDQILAVLGRTERKGQRTAQADRAAELDAPTDIAAEIRAQFEERDRQQAARASADADKSWRDSVESRLTGMTEQRPEAPARPIEKRMGWR